MTTVLHSYPVWLPQTQTWMYNQVRYLPDDVEAHVVCERTENLDQFRVPNIHCLADAPVLTRLRDNGLRRFGLHHQLGFLAHVARTRDADIIHSHFGHIGWMDMSAARRAGIKHVVTFYGLDVNFLPRHRPVWRRRYRTLFDHVDRVLCEGGHMADCVASLGCPRDKLRVHHLGIAVEEIPYRPCPWRPGERLRVLIAASFREKKGIPDALSALARLRQRTPLAVTIIGDAGDEPRARDEKAKIVGAVDRYEFGEDVRMLGFQPHARLLEEARRHHIFLSPSRTASDGDTEGGAPVSLLDMAASGTLVVSARHCDIPEVVVDGETGLLAREGDVDSLVTKLEWVVAHPDAWDGMLAAARRHVESGYSARLQAETLAELYRAVAA